MQMLKAFLLRIGTREKSPPGRPPEAIDIDNTHTLIPLSFGRCHKLPAATTEIVGGTVGEQHFTTMTQMRIHYIVLYISTHRTERLQI